MGGPPVGKKGVFTEFLKSPGGGTNIRETEKGYSRKH